MDQPTWAAARQAWARGDDRLAGQLLLKLLPRRLRPTWAATILEDVIQAGGAHHAVHQVLAIARDPSRWQEGHGAFQAVRELTVEQERPDSPTDPLRTAVLRIAEDAALLTYASSQPRTALDPDCGQWLPGNVRRLIQLLGDLELRRRLESDVLCLHWKD